MLKPAFSDDRGWQTTSFVANMSDAIPHTASGNAIVLIDEFSGSGRTLQKAVSWCRRQLEEKGINAKIYACCLAAMESGIEKVRQETDDFFACHVIKREISDHFKDEELIAAISMMERLEGELAPKVGDEALDKYKFGYKRSEALYYFQNGNSVNNTFPIFWWKELKNNKYWQPLLKRI